MELNISLKSISLCTENFFSNQTKFSVFLFNVFVGGVCLVLHWSARLVVHSIRLCHLSIFFSIHPFISIWLYCTNPVAQLIMNIFPPIFFKLCFDEVDKSDFHQHSWLYRSVCLSDRHTLKVTVWADVLFLQQLSNVSPYIFFFFLLLQYLSRLVHNRQPYTA